MLAALNLAHGAAIIDTGSGEVADYVSTGRYPYGAAILADGRRGLISNEADGTVSVIDLEGGSEIEEIRVGPHLSHPEGIAVDPKRPLAYVAVTHQDLIAVINTNTLEVVRTLSVERPQGIGTAPVHLSVTADGCRLLSANSGEDAIAVFALSANARCEPRRARGARARAAAVRRANELILAREGQQGFELSESELAERAEVLGEEAEERVEEELEERPVRRRGKRWQLLGRIPVGSYPTAVFATPQPVGKRRLVWIAAKGLGVGSNEARRGEQIPPDPGSATGNAPDRFRFRYLPANVFGLSGITAFPSQQRLRRMTPRASRVRQVRPRSADPGTAARSPGALLLQRRLLGWHQRDHDAGGVRLLAPGRRQPADHREPVRVLQGALSAAARR